MESYIASHSSTLLAGQRDPTKSSSRVGERKPAAELKRAPLQESANASNSLHLSVGQNKATRGPQALVFGSTYRVPFWVPVFDPQPFDNWTVSELDARCRLHYHWIHTQEGRHAQDQSGTSRHLAFWRLAFPNIAGICSPRMTRPATRKRAAKGPRWTRGEGSETGSVEAAPGAKEKKKPPRSPGSRGRFSRRGVVSPAAKRFSALGARRTAPRRSRSSCSRTSCCWAGHGLWRCWGPRRPGRSCAATSRRRWRQGGARGKKTEERAGPAPKKRHQVGCRTCKTPTKIRFDTKGAQ